MILSDLFHKITVFPRYRETVLKFWEGLMQKPCITRESYHFVNIDACKFFVQMFLSLLVVKAAKGSSCMDVHRATFLCQRRGPSKKGTSNAFWLVFWKSRPNYDTERTALLRVNLGRQGQCRLVILLFRYKLKQQLGITRDGFWYAELTLLASDCTFTSLSIPDLGALWAVRTDHDGLCWFWGIILNGATLTCAAIPLQSFDTMEVSLSLERIKASLEFGGNSVKWFPY